MENKNVLDLLDENTKNNVLLWKEFDEDAKTEIEQILKTTKENVKERFSKKLEFGTAGIRAKMGIGSNRLNKYTIAMVSQGLANFLKKKYEQPSCIIGYDNRNNSKFFATITAKILFQNGIKVFLFKNLRPTPLLSFGCREKKCSSAVMITASHNTKEYNGFKVYMKDGGQITSPIDKEIIEEVNKINSVPTINEDAKIEFIEEEIDNKYLEKLKTLKKREIENDDLKILYTSLHGTGITIIPKALNMWGFKDVEILKEQCTIDGNFPFAPVPNPEEKATLELGIEKMVAENKDIFIATDPDADRICVVAMKNNIPFILTGNQIACILLKYILEHSKNLKNKVAIKSIVTTELFKKICLDYKIKCIDVLTGFKYVAEKIKNFEKDQNNKFLLGAEESYGYLIEDFVRDKDSISAACYISEIAHFLKKENKTLIDFLYEIYEKYGVYKDIVINISKEDMDFDIPTLMEALRKYPPLFLGKYKIFTEEDFYTGKKIDIINGKITKIKNFPKSNVIKYTLEDNSTVVLRPSGTEPKAKIYISTHITDFKDISSAFEFLDQKLDDIKEGVQEEFFI